MLEIHNCFLHAIVMGKKNNIDDRENTNKGRKRRIKTD